MKKLLPVIIAASLATGCASLKTQPMTMETGNNLKDKTVTYTVREKPSFSALTALNAQFGLLGAAAAISNGNKLIASNSVADPADFVASELIKELQTARNSVSAAAPLNIKGNDTTQIANAAKGAAHYVVDVQTINWSLGYFPTDWTHYRVMYIAKAKLIDATNSKVIAEGFCRYIPDSNIGAPSWDELTANQAQRLKSILSGYASTCVKTLKKEMLVI